MRRGSPQRRTVGEMVRVARSGGQVTLYDPVLPKSALVRPHAYALGKLDRGRFIQPEPLYRSRILMPWDWDAKRITHSYIGTEGLLCTHRKA